jgi:hypothetical protein
MKRLHSFYPGIDRRQRKRARLGLVPAVAEAASVAEPKDVAHAYSDGYRYRNRDIHADSYCHGHFYADSHSDCYRNRDKTVMILAGDTFRSLDSYYVTWTTNQQKRTANE